MAITATALLGIGWKPGRVTPFRDSRGIATGYSFYGACISAYGGSFELAVAISKVARFVPEGLIIKWEETPGRTLADVVELTEKVDYHMFRLRNPSLS